MYNFAVYTVSFFIKLNDLLKCVTILLQTNYSIKLCSHLLFLIVSHLVFMDPSL